MGCLHVTFIKSRRIMKIIIVMWVRKNHELFIVLFTSHAHVVCWYVPDFHSFLGHGAARTERDHEAVVAHCAVDAVTFSNLFTHRHAHHCVQNRQKEGEA